MSDALGTAQWGILRGLRNFIVIGDTPGLPPSESESQFFQRLQTAAPKERGLETP